MQALRKTPVLALALLLAPVTASGQFPSRATMDSVSVGTLEDWRVVVRVMVEDAETGDCNSTVHIHRYSHSGRGGGVEYSVGWTAGDDPEKPRSTFVVEAVRFVQGLAGDSEYSPLAPMIAQILRSLEEEVVAGERGDPDAFGVHSFAWADLLRESGNCRGRPDPRTLQNPT